MEDVEVLDYGEDPLNLTTKGYVDTQTLWGSPIYNFFDDEPSKASEIPCI